MRHSASVKRILLTACLAVCGTSLALNAHGNERTAPKKSAWKAPRTLDGQPDLQGNWSNATLTQLERAPQLGTRLNLTAEEAAKIEGTAAQHVEDNAKPTDPSLGIQDLPKDCGYGFVGTNCGYNNFWVDRGTQVIRIDGTPRSSILVEPANGRIPEMTQQARRQLAARGAGRRGRGTDGPEARSLGERCLMSFGS